MRGIATVALGLFLLIWPIPTLASLVVLFAAYAFADGVFALIALARRGRIAGRGALAAEGGVGVAIGIVTLLWPGLSLLSFI